MWNFRGLKLSRFWSTLHNETFFFPILLLKSDIFCWHFHGRNQICSGVDIRVCNWTWTQFRRSFGLIGKSSFSSIDRRNWLINRTPLYNCEVFHGHHHEFSRTRSCRGLWLSFQRELFFYYNFWALWYYLNFDKEIERGDFLDGNTNISVRRSLIDTIMVLVKPIVAENHECLSSCKFFYQNFWDFPEYHNFDAKIERSDTRTEFSKIKMQLSVENFMEGIKSIATVNIRAWSSKKTINNSPLGFFGVWTLSCEDENKWFFKRILGNLLVCGIFGWDLQGRSQGWTDWSIWASAWRKTNKKGFSFRWTVETLSQRSEWTPT